MIVRLIDNPLDASDVVVKDFEFQGESIPEIFLLTFDCLFKIQNYRIICSGKQVEIDYILSPEDDLIFVREMSGGKNGGLISVILGVVMIVTSFLLPTTAPAWLSSGMLAAGIGMALSGAISLLFSSQMPTSDMGDSNTYQWSGMQNMVGEGHPIPIIYGDHRSAGIYVEGFVDGEFENKTTKSNFLYLMQALSEGPVHGIHEETLEINKQPVWTYTTDDMQEKKAEIFISAKTLRKSDVDGIIVAAKSAIDSYYYKESVQREGGREVGVG